MSKDWGLHCKTCDSMSVDDFSNGEHMLRSMVKAYPHIKAAKEADKSGFLEISIMGHSWISDDFFEWLAEHSEHDLELQDEYSHVKPLEEQEAVRGTNTEANE